jgi:cytochrome P450
MLGIGKAFATQELSVALSMLIRKFDIICDYDRPVKESYSPVPSPGNLYLKFIPRY